MRTLQKDKMVEHFQKVFSQVTRGRSQLGERQEEMYSLAGVPMKHLVNTLCDLGYKVNYLELGAYRGATLIAALWKNDVNAYAVEHFKYDATSPNRYMEDGHPNVKIALENTINTYKKSWNGENSIKVIESDLHNVDLKEIDKKIDVVFHDADKKDKDIENFIVKYKEVLDKYCVLAFTKLQDVGVQGKIENALKSNGFTIIAEQLIPDTDMGLDGRSAVGLYYVENKIVPQKVKA